MYWHSLTPILVVGLEKLYRGVLAKGENKIHLLKELTGENRLATHEWNNFTKLRFHGLADKYIENGEHHSGYWFITEKGINFLAGWELVPKRVQTFRNKVVGYDRVTISYSDVATAETYVEEEFDFELANL